MIDKGVGGVGKGPSSSASGSKKAIEVSEDVGIEEELRKPQIARRPYTPTRAEVDAHLPLHLEYSSWCKHCRESQGMSMRHAQNLDGHANDPGATVTLDYCFMTPGEE